MFNPFRRKDPALQTPMERLIKAVDDFNAAYAELPAGNAVTPWVERRPGQRSQLILQRWSPGDRIRVHPET